MQKKLNFHFLFFATTLDSYKMSMLPMYFAVNFGMEFKLFQNSIYKISSKKSINVLWPIADVNGGILIVRDAEERNEVSSIRKWNGRLHTYLNWTFTGSSLYIELENYNLSNIVPIIYIQSEDLMKLPYNNFSFTHEDIQSIDEPEDKTSYILAKIYTTDPNSDENTFPIPQPIYSELPIAPIAPTEQTEQTGQTGQTEQTGQIGPLISFPSHITRLIIDNAISSNDTSTCIISGEDLTRENASVTKCGHVFTTHSIKKWLASPSSRGECPICKQQCQ